MKPLTPYLFFNGNAREAMNFYKECFGGELECMTYADAPQGENMEEGCAGSNQEGIMHACLRSGDLTLMASDWNEAKEGNNFRMNIDCSSKNEIERIFKALSTKGKVDQALQDTFWGSHFGMVTDQFGMQWMLSLPLER